LNTGYALKKKKELYKHAESNRTGGGPF
jgi:ribosomal protein S7